MSISVIHIGIAASIHGLAFPHLVCVESTIVPITRSVSASIAVLIATPIEIAAAAMPRLFVAKYVTSPIISPAKIFPNLNNANPNVFFFENFSSAIFNCVVSIFSPPKFSVLIALPLKLFPLRV